MKFSFVNPAPSPEIPEIVISAWPPLGMLYCMNLLRHDGFEVSLLDQVATGYSLKQTLNWIKREDPDILGVSVLTSSSRTAPMIAKAAKELNPNLKVVFGNYHATFNDERILRKYPSVDIIVRGEGEYTCTELAQRLKEGRDLKNVRGITYRKGKRIIRTGDRDLIRDLDSLDFPDRSLLNVEYDSKICGLNVATRKFTTIVSSRGCPFRCTFCGCRKFARGLWRVRSVENVVDELEFLQSQGFGQFLFVDDNFTVDHRRVTRFCETLRKRKLDIEWFCDSRVDEVNLEVFRGMVRTGCKNVYFGVESANQRLLNAYKKGTTPDQARKAVKIARKAGIDAIVGSFVVGGEDETREEIAETLRFALELDIDVPTFSVLGAFTGTDLWNDLVAKGFVNEDEHWENGVYATSVSPYAVPLEEINQMIYNCFVAFMTRPEFIGKEVLRTIVSPYRRKVLLNNITHMSEIVKIVKQEITFEEGMDADSVV